MDSRRLEPFESEAAAGARGKSRDSLFMQATLAIDGFADPVSARVRNLSAGGMLAESPTVVTAEATVLADLPNIGRVPGRIVWANAGKFGVAFDRPINPQAVRRKLTRSVEMPTVISGLGLGKAPIRRG